MVVLLSPGILITYYASEILNITRFLVSVFGNYFYHKYVNMPLYI